MKLIAWSLIPLPDHNEVRVCLEILELVDLEVLSYHHQMVCGDRIHQDVHRCRRNQIDHTSSSETGAVSTRRVVSSVIAVIVLDLTTPGVVCRINQFDNVTILKNLSKEVLYLWLIRTRNSFNCSSTSNFTRKVRTYEFEFQNHQSSVIEQPWISSICFSSSKLDIVVIRVMI